VFPVDRFGHPKIMAPLSWKSSTRRRRWLSRTLFRKFAEVRASLSPVQTDFKQPASACCHSLFNRDDIARKNAHAPPPPSGRRARLKRHHQIGDQGTLGRALGAPGAG